VKWISVLEVTETYLTTKENIGNGEIEENVKHDFCCGNFKIVLSL